MKIAVLSGKGGTGKTLVSVNLSAVLEHSVYADCDVEAPNGNLFYKVPNMKKREVKVRIPKFHEGLCDGCKKCIEFCQFHALAYVSEKPMLFPEVCHSCGGCKLVCENHAITEKEKPVGIMEQGESQGVQILSGTMKIGEVSGVPIIKEIFKRIKDEEKDIVIDCPPGSGCMVMEIVKESDYCILVAEPTEFGRHNLEMVHELVNIFQKSFGVVLNKCIDAGNPSENYCLQKDIPVLGKIPFDSALGSLNAEGKIIIRERKDMKEVFLKILQKIHEEADI